MFVVTLEAKDRPVVPGKVVLREVCESDDERWSNTNPTPRSASGSWGHKLKSWVAGKYWALCRFRTSAHSVSRKFAILRQVVGDTEPCCLGADKDVSRRSNGRLVNERSKRDMHELAFPDDRVKQRSALGAMGVVC